MVKHSLLAATLAGLILAAPVFGHAKLRSTMPIADARLEVAPKSLTLSFNEDVRLAILTLTASGKDVPVAVDRSAPATSQVTVALPALAIGKYQVQWRALSADDGHVVKGMFSFSIVGPSTVPAAAAAMSR